MIATTASPVNLARHADSRSHPNSSIQIERLIDQFIEYRRVARNNSLHTLKAYSSDLAQFAGYLDTRRITSAESVNLAILRAFLASLLENEYERATLARKQAALRAFFGWAKRHGRIP